MVAALLRLEVPAGGVGGQPVPAASSLSPVTRDGVSVSLPAVVAVAAVGAVSAWAAVIPVTSSPAAASTAATPWPTAMPPDLSALFLRAEVRTTDPFAAMGG